MKAVRWLVFLFLAGCQGAPDDGAGEPIPAPDPGHADLVSAEIPETGAMDTAAEVPSPGFAWGQAGLVSTTAGGGTLSSPGYRLTLYAAPTAPPARISSPGYRLLLGPAAPSMLSGD